VDRGLKGIFPAVVTPMTAHQDVDYEMLLRFVDYLVGTGGVHGVIPLGSTGEYYALDAEERKRVVQGHRQ